MNNMVNLPQYTEVLTANGCLQDKEYANYSLLSIPLSGSDTSYSSYLYTSHADTSPTKSYMCCALKSHTIYQSSLRVDTFVIGCAWLDETHDKEVCTLRYSAVKWMYSAYTTDHQRLMIPKQGCEQLLFAETIVSRIRYPYSILSCCATYHHLQQ